MSALSIAMSEHPNGQIYGVFYLGNDEIGRADVIGDGWRVFGKKKVVSSIQAAKAMIDGKIDKARRDEILAREMLNKLRIFNGGSLPPK